MEGCVLRCRFGSAAHLRGHRLRQLFLGLKRLFESVIKLEHLSLFLLLQPPVLAHQPEVGWNGLGVRFEERRGGGRLGSRRITVGAALLMSSPRSI